MTLIVSLLTQRFVMQVSDMRLTRPNGERFYADTAKTVVYMERFLFSYTGAAELAGMRADEWLAERLGADRPLREKLEQVRVDAARAVQRYQRRASHLVFVGIGWPAKGAWVTQPAVLIEISNAPDGFDEPAATEFYLRSEQLRSREPRLVSHGQPVPAALWKRLRRDVRGRESARSSPGTFADIIARAAREVAASNPLCGPELLVSSLPKPGSREEPMADLAFNLGAPTWTGPEYRFIAGPEYGFRGREKPPIVRLPTFVTPDFLLSDMYFGPSDGEAGLAPIWRPEPQKRREEPTNDAE